MYGICQLHPNLISKKIDCIQQIAFKKSTVDYTTLSNLEKIYTAQEIHLNSVECERTRPPEDF